MKTLHNIKFESAMAAVLTTVILPIAVFCLAVGLYEVGTRFILPALVQLTDLITPLRWI